MAAWAAQRVGLTSEDSQDITQVLYRHLIQLPSRSLDMRRQAAQAAMVVMAVPAQQVTLVVLVVQEQ
jgi:hypothetical protein